MELGYDDGLAWLGFFWSEERSRIAIGACMIWKKLVWVCDGVWQRIIYLDAGAERERELVDERKVAASILEDLNAEVV